MEDGDGLLQRGSHLYERALVLTSQSREQDSNACVKIGLNSKTPSRFRPVVFYKPKASLGLRYFQVSLNWTMYWGTGWSWYVVHGLPFHPAEWSPMLKADGCRSSVVALLILFFSFTSFSVTHSRAGMSHEEDLLIPNLYRYLWPWQADFLELARLWMEANAQNRRLTVGDLEESFFVVFLVSILCSTSIVIPEFGVLSHYRLIIEFAPIPFPWVVDLIWIFVLLNVRV